jgi:ligand-binding SRPBCC domain-containing protein
MPARTIEVSSLLRAPRDAVWLQVSTMGGVNEELAPWLAMSFPAEASGRRVSVDDVGQPLFTSTIRILGILPYDRHTMRLTRVVPGEGFLEESTSWMMRSWRHERTLSAEAEGTKVTDRVTFEPRTPGVLPLVERVVRAVFQHRHAVLARRFGGGRTGDAEVTRS